MLRFFRGIPKSATTKNSDWSDPRGPIRSRIRALSQSTKWSRFCLQVPNFLFYLQTLLKRGGRHIAVRHRCALFRHTLTIRHIFEMGLSGPLISTDTERSKNDPKKCPIQSQKPKFGLYGAFLRKVPKSKSD